MYIYVCIYRHEYKSVGRSIRNPFAYCYIRLNSLNIRVDWCLGVCTSEAEARATRDRRNRQMEREWEKKSYRSEKCLTHMWFYAFFFLFLLADTEFGLFFILYEHIWCKGAVCFDLYDMIVDGVCMSNILPCRISSKCSHLVSVDSCCCCFHKLWRCMIYCYIHMYICLYTIL